MVGSGCIYVSVWSIELWLVESGYIYVLYLDGVLNYGWLNQDTSMYCICMEYWTMVGWIRKYLCICMEY